MRILALQDHLRCGGNERLVLFLCRFFQRAGHEVSLLAFRPGGRLEPEALADGIRYRALQPFDLGLDFVAPGLLREIRRQRPDAVLCMGRVANCFAGVIQRRFPQVAVLGTLRTGRRLPALNRWSFERLPAVLADSEWWRRRLIAEGFPPEKLRVVPNPVVYAWEDRDRARAREEARERLGAGPSTVVFVNVAGFRPGKRQALLVELFSRLDPAWDCQLWLVGDGRARRRCQRLAEASAPRGRIRFPGHADDPYPYYAGADVALSASVQDAFPHFLVEAQSLGLPAIACDYRGVGEIVQHGRTGYLVPAEDRGRFRERVERLYFDRASRERMGAAAAALAAERFSAERVGAQVLELLIELHHRRGGAQGPATSRR